MRLSIPRHSHQQLVHEIHLLFQNIRGLLSHSPST